MKFLWITKNIVCDFSFSETEEIQENIVISI